MTERGWIAAAAFVAMGCTSVEPVLDLGALTDRERDGFMEVFGAEALGGPFALDRCEATGTLFILGTAAPECTDGICGLWALERREGVWDLILEGEGAPRIAASQSMGRPDIVTEAPGQPAIVHKFDGYAYRSDLDGMIYGEIVEPPQEDGWEAETGAPAPVVEVDDTAGFDAVLAKLPADAAARFARADLNGDALPEIVALAQGAAHCAGGACTLWIFRMDGSLLATARSADWPEPAISMSDGHRDIIVWGAAGPEVLRFDGTAYR